MWFKLSRIARSTGADLWNALSPELQALVSRSAGGIKLLSDAPLELLPIDGLPLSLQRECSRVTTTSGNLFAKQVLRAEVVPFTAAAFRKVLILRSYRDDDPVRHHLQNGVTEWLEHAQHTLQVQWRDVASSDALVAELETFDGELLVVDMHGSHAAPGGHGALAVGPEAFNAWRLESRVRIPAVVILSACETHAVGASHATVANGFLNAGAHTVLATLTPVQSHHSAYFIGRLLFHVADRIAEIGRQPTMMRWSTFMLDLRRRMYEFDVLRQLRAAGRIALTDEEFNSLLAASSRTTGEAKWFADFVERIAAATGHSADTVRKLHQSHAYFTDTLEYVELGSPERLLILGTIAH